MPATRRTGNHPLVPPPHGTNLLPPMSPIAPFIPEVLEPGRDGA